MKVKGGRHMVDVRWVMIRCRAELESSVVGSKGEE